MAKYIAEVTVKNERDKYLTPIKKIGTYKLEDFDIELFGEFHGIRLRGNVDDIIDSNCLYTFDIEDNALDANNTRVLPNNTHSSDPSIIFGKNIYLFDPPHWSENNIKLKKFKEKFFHKFAEYFQISEEIDFNQIYNFLDNIPLNHTPLTNTIYLTNSKTVIGPFSWELNDDNYTYLITPHNSVDYMTDSYVFSDFEQYCSDVKTQNGECYHLILNRTKKDNLKIQSLIDCIPTNNLVRSFFQNVPTRSLTETAITSSSFSEERKNRLFEIIKQQNKNKEQVTALLKEIAKDDVLMQDINDYRSDFGDNYQNITSINSENDTNEIIKELKTTVVNLEEEKYQLEKEKLEKEEENKKIIEQYKTSLQNAELIEENEKLKQEISESTRKKEDLKKDKDELLKELGGLEQTKNEYITEIENKYADKIQNITKYAINSTFDTQVIGTILKVASQHNFNTIKDTINVHRFEENNCIYKKYSHPKDLLTFLYNNFKPIRKKYTQNDIANILLCLSLGFLTIFAGEPGTGKTSFVKYLAKFFGLTGNKNTNGSDIKRYVEVAVEKGWTSKKDLLGFYNPLAKEFNTNNQELYSSILQLQKEQTEENPINDFPFFILLDEANLSPMEYYWADFMKICDYQNIEQCKINLYEGFDFIIPKYLRFLATINLDHTTEILSPRLIDRSWIIKLPNPNYSFEEYLNTNNNFLLDKYPLIHTDVLKTIIDTTMNKNDINTNISKTLEDIIKNFNMINIKFSPRIMTMILKYCIAADKLNLMNTKDNELTALDYAVAQKILPMIDGQGEQFKKLITNLKDIMTEEKMPKCYEILIDIERKAENNGMEYYQFFAR